MASEEEWTDDDIETSRPRKRTKNRNVRYAVDALVSARTDAGQTVNLTARVQTNEKGGGIIHYVTNLKLVPI